MKLLFYVFSSNICYCHIKHFLCFLNFNQQIESLSKEEEYRTEIEHGS